MTEHAWDRLVQRARADEDVVGLVLTGGRGKGVATARSDWDGLLVVADGALPRWSTTDVGELDLTVLGAAEFARYAEPGTAFAWRAYDLAHLQPALDRDGFGAALAAKGRLEKDRARVTAEEHLGAALTRSTARRRTGATAPSRPPYSTSRS